MLVTRRAAGVSGLSLVPLATVSKQQAGSPAAGAAAMRRIDAHVHVWAPVELSDRYPYAGALLGAAPGSKEAPPMPGDGDLLIKEMAAAGVAGALIVQPGNHLYDHSYLEAVLAAHPGRFVGCLLADPTPGGGGAAEVSRLHRAGLRAVRFNPYLWPDGERMTNEVGRAMYAKAGELGMPVCHMPFKGLLGVIDDIEALASDCPRTPAVIDHFGFCSAEDLGSEEWRRLLALARHPQVYVKASAFFRVSRTPYPYSDAVAALRALVDAFGAQRVMWGTDWPWVSEKCGYVKAWGILEAAAADSEAAAAAALSQKEAEWVMGGTLASLFPGAWDAGAA